MITKKLKFLVDGVVNGEVVFVAGETYDIPVETGSVTRWLKRGAVEVEEVLEVKEVAEIATLEELVDFVEEEKENLEVENPIEQGVKLKASKKSKKLESL